MRGEIKCFGMCQEWGNMAVNRVGHYRIREASGVLPDAVSSLMRIQK